MKFEAAKLKELLAKWREWSQTADRSEDGWQTYFSDWESIVNTAEALMTHGDITDEELRMVEMCWQMGEEDEELADYAKANLTLCWTVLIRLITSRFSEVRWQIYEVLGEGGNKAESLLRQGLDDENSYCRRRALLSFARIAPHDAKTIAIRFINDPDPYIRQVAYELTS